MTENACSKGANIGSKEKWELIVTVRDIFVFQFSALLHMSNCLLGTCFEENLPEFDKQFTFHKC
jgi:hypothetical protein